MMARKQHRSAAALQCLLEPQSIYCQECDQLMWVAYATRRTVTILNGVTRLTLKIRRCHDENCTRAITSLIDLKRKEHGHYRMESLASM